MRDPNVRVCAKAGGSANLSQEEKQFVKGLRIDARKPKAMPRPIGSSSGIKDECAKK